MTLLPCVRLLRTGRTCQQLGQPPRRQPPAPAPPGALAVVQELVFLVQAVDQRIDKGKLSGKTNSLIKKTKMIETCSASRAARCSGAVQARAVLQLVVAVLLYTK